MHLILNCSAKSKVSKKKTEETRKKNQTNYCKYSMVFVQLTPIGRCRRALQCNICIELTTINITVDE